MRKVKILFVDDESLNCKWFSKTMQLLGFEVDVLDTVDKAVEATTLAPADYDVVITDYRFENNAKGETGLDFLKKIKNQDAFKMICTAYENINENSTSYEVVHKPIDYPSLVKKINDRVNLSSHFEQ